MSGAPPVGVALLGYGLGGQAFHAPFVAATPGLRLAAIVTGSPERQAQAARDHPDARVLPDAEAVWADPSIELVAISTPNRTHAELAMRALAAGKHVVVDKPFAPTAAEAARVAEEAAARGRVLSVYQNRRFDGDFRTMRRLLAEGRVGAPIRFTSRFERWRPAPRGGWREAGDPGEAGGTLFDLGSHLIDQALVLLGPVVAVYAEVAALRAGVASDDDVFLALTHASGARSHLFASAMAARQGPRFVLQGTLAGYEKWGMDPQEAALRAGARPGGAGWGEEPEAAWGTLGAGDPPMERVRTEAGDYGAFYAAMAEAVRAGGSAPVDPWDAVRGLRVIEAARRSAASGEVVRDKLD